MWAGCCWRPPPRTWTWPRCANTCSPCPAWWTCTTCTPGPSPAECRCSPHTWWSTPTKSTTSSGAAPSTRWTSAWTDTSTWPTAPSSSSRSGTCATNRPCTTERSPGGAKAPVANLSAMDHPNQPIAALAQGNDDLETSRGWGVPAGPLASWFFTGELRRSQRVILQDESVRDSLAATEPVHIVAPPGSGKTLLGLLLAMGVGRRALALTPTATIRHQWADTAEELAAAGANPAGANPTGANPAGANPTGANPPAATPPAPNPAAANPAGATPAGATPAGANPAGANPAGANPTGANPTGANPAGAAVSEEPQQLGDFTALTYQ